MGTPSPTPPEGRLVFRRHRLLPMLLVLACGSPSSEVAPPPSSPSEGSVLAKDLNRRFLDPKLDVRKEVERFEGESRELARCRDRVIDALELRPGLDVADVGAGTGLYSLEMARRVAPGVVYAVDIAPRFVEFIAERARRAGLDNVETVLCTERDPRLAPGSVDVVFVCDTYHHFAYPREELRHLRLALRPGGRLVVVDFEKIEGKTKPFFMQHVRAGKEVVRREIEEAGFRFLAEPKVEGLEENYVLVFERP